MGFVFLLYSKGRNYESSAMKKDDCLYLGGLLDLDKKNNSVALFFIL